MENRPTAAVIIIGNEILSGRTIDQNIPFLAQRLNELGIRLQHVHVIGDIADTIINTTLSCHKNVTYVFTTGGIGPTHDDITAETIANAFACPLELHPVALELLNKFYGENNLNPARRRMALIPKGAKLIPNPVSAAPGFYLYNVFVMAGVPDIMKAMFNGITHLLVPGPKIYSQTIHSAIGESALAEELTIIQKRYPNIEIGSYPYFKNRAFGLSLVLRGIDQNSLSKAANEVMNLVKEKGGNPELKISS